MRRPTKRPAKLTRPRLYGAMPRTRLFELLEARRSHAAVWVCGPPGAGKTTLVASYAESVGARCLWYQADAQDLDPASFCYFLGQAVSESGQKLPLLTPEYLADLESFGRRFFRDLFSRLEADVRAGRLAPRAAVREVAELLELPG